MLLRPRQLEHEKDESLDSDERAEADVSALAREKFRQLVAELEEEKAHGFLAAGAASRRLDAVEMVSR